ncbi:adhesin [Paraburkholderia graminis]|nr:adhesin [Paraburkholderia graminis]
MNKAFRSVWNESTGTWVAAQEDAKGKSKNSKPACKSRLSAISCSLGGSAGIALAIFSLPASASVLCLYDNIGKDQVSSNSTFASGCSSRYVPSSDYYALLESGSPSGASGIVLQAGNITYYLASTMTQNTLTMSVSDTNVLLDGLAPGAVTASSLNAISGSQLYGTASTTAAALGTTMAANGTIVAPGYALPQANAIDGTSGPANNVSSAFATVDTALGKLSDKLSAGIEYFHANSALADSSAIGSEAIAIGGAAAASSGGAIAVGQLSMSNGTAAVAIGQNATATGIANIAIGQRATNAATLNNSIAIGGDSKSGGQSSSLGNSADTSATTFAVAVGHSSVVTGSSGTALGAGASAATANSVAVGSNSVANSTTLATAGFTPLGGTAISAGTAAGGEVSVGSAGAERRITNVAAGLNATDAVNLSQLMSEDAKVNTINNNVNNLSNTVNNIVNGGGIKYFNANSTLADSSATGTDAVSIGGNAQATTANSVALGSNSVANSSTLATAGFNPGSSAISAATAAGGEVSVGASGAERRITNVAAGLNATDAVNVSQLQSEDAKVNQIGTSTAASLGGGSTYDTTTGAITNPTYSVGGTTVNNVGDALTNLDGRTTQNTTNIGSLTQNINNGTVGLVQQDATSRNVTVAKDTGGTVVNFTGTAGSRTLTGVAAGALNATSVDVVNGSQLYATNLNVSNLTNVVNNISSGGGIKYFNANSTLADSSATGTDAVAIGGNAQATTMNSVALGSNSVANSTTLATAGFNPGGSTISAATAAGGEVSVGAAGAERRITNVAAGQNPTDAVNVSQLQSEDAKVNQIGTSTASSLGGGSTYDTTTGAIAAPAYSVGGTTVNNVGDALTNLDGRTTQNTSDITNINNTLNNITNGGVATRYFHANTTLPDSQATGAESVAIGGNAQSLATNSVALGSNSAADRANTVSVGSAGNERQITNVAAGTADTDAVNLAQLKASGIINPNGTTNAAVTYDHNADGTTNYSSVTMGNGAAGGTTIRNVAAGTSGNHAVNVDQMNAAISTATDIAKAASNPMFAADGNQDTQMASATGSYSTAMGASANAGGKQSIAAGNNANASSEGATAIGANTQATGKGSVALGSDSVADRDNTVSVGSATNQRQVANVAAGTATHDAVNFGQLNDAIGNLPAGMTAKTYVDQQINSVQNSVNQVARSAYSGIAAATALTMIPDVDEDKRIAVGIGGGSYKGAQAVALGISARINDNLKMKAGAGTSSGDTTFGVGASYQW